MKKVTPWWGSECAPRSSLVCALPGNDGSVLCIYLISLMSFNFSFRFVSLQCIQHKSRPNINRFLFGNVDRQTNFPLRRHHKEERLKFLAGGVTSFGIFQRKNRNIKVNNIPILNFSLPVQQFEKNDGPHLNRWRAL